MKHFANLNATASGQVEQFPSENLAPLIKLNYIHRAPVAIDRLPYFSYYKFPIYE